MGILNGKDGVNYVIYNPCINYQFPVQIHGLYMILLCINQSCAHMFYVKSIIIFLMGCGLTSILTISSYRTHVDNLRNRERKIVTEVTTQLQMNLEITIGESIMPIVVGSMRGELTPGLFESLTDPILISSLSVTSIGWVPRVEADEREAFIRNNSNTYDNLTISIIGESGMIIPRPMDDLTMWPLLHGNPIINEDFRGVDLYTILWKESIDLMVEQNRTIISNLVHLQRPLDNDDGVFTNKRSVYQLFQPVFDIQTYRLIGIFNRLFFPSVLVVSSLKTTSICDIDKYQISITRTKYNGIREAIHIETNTGNLMKSGKNTYKEEIIINHNLFSVELITQTVPCFRTYGIILIVTFISCVVVSRMYIVQMKTSRKDKDMSIKYKKATDMKSTFLAEMSHELRTPLNGIIGTVDVISELDISSEIRGYMNDIKSCGNILITLITGILDFSKIEAGKVDLDISELSIGTILHDTVKVMVQSFNDKKEVDVKLNMVSVPGQTFGDENRIRQIFMNMISNALKFTESGTITVDVSSTENVNGVDGTYLQGEYEESILLNISVEDTGVGISPDRISDLFQPFSQIRGKSSVGGTGLGLIITKTLCESMGGTVSCSSVYTKGSCFSCKILLGLPSTIRQHSKYSNWNEWNLSQNLYSDTDDIESGTYTKPKHGQVLVVDDILINLKVAEKLLELEGVTCDTASDGVYAIELCKKYKYKLIIMDYYMPGMSGVDVAVAIRGDKSSKNQDCSIICLTASHTKETIDSIEGSGMDGYELKPIRKKMIQDLCKRYIN